MKKKTKSKNTKKTNSFAEIIDNIIFEAAKDPNNQLFINSMSRQNGYEKRRLYDLFNVFSVYDLCVKSGSNTYIWKGLDNVFYALIRFAKEVELQSLTQSYESILKLPDPASLILISKRFMFIFLFLGKSRLQIHDMATAMAPNTVPPKKILRRLYLVAHILEHLTILVHSQVIGEYELTFDVLQINQIAINEMRQNSEFPPDSVYSRLNRFEDIPRANIYQQRMKAYTAAINTRRNLYHEDVDFYDSTDISMDTFTLNPINA